jgi:hypothetical protein
MGLPDYINWKSGFQMSARLTKTSEGLVQLPLALKISFDALTV